MKDKPITNPVKRFVSLLKVGKQEVLSIYVYALFNGLLSLSVPLGIQAIINLLTSGQVSTAWIVLVVFVITGVALTGVLQIAQLTITENLQQKIFTKSAFEFAYRIPRLKMEAVEKYYIPELANRFFDTLSVQKGLTKILMDFSSASLQVIFGLILLSLYHPFFIPFGMFSIVIVYLIFRYTSPKGLSTSLVESKHKYAVAHWLEEIARTMETFKLAGKSPLPLTKTDDKVGEYLIARRAHFKTLVIQYINLVGFKVLVAAGLLIIGGLLVFNGQMNIGQFVASEIIIILILSSVEKLIVSMETIYDVLTSLEKIGDVTDFPLDMNDFESSPTVSTEGIRVHAEELSYKFKDARYNVLENINLDVQAGEKVCVSGESGSGKSFLLQVLAALYDEFNGVLSYHDLPVGNWNREDLHMLIGDSLLKEDIFNGTVLENITLGKQEVSFEEVQEFAKVLGLAAYIEDLPSGYQTVLIPEGKGLPKSIRLKLMLARCFAGAPKLVLLEDNFNLLDPDDQDRILNYILSRGWTVIAVSNDLHVASRFDKIHILKEGTIVASGSPIQLTESKFFKQIFE